VETTISCSGSSSSSSSSKSPSLHLSPSLVVLIRWRDTGRQLCSISAYELQLIDEEVRDVGLAAYSGMDTTTTTTTTTTCWWRA